MLLSCFLSKPELWAKDLLLQEALLDLTPPSAVPRRLSALCPPRSVSVVIKSGVFLSPPGRRV